MNVQATTQVANSYGYLLSCWMRNTEDSLPGGVAADTAAEISAETAVLIAGKQYCSILYVKCACMYGRIMRSVTCTLIGARVVAENLCIITLDGLNRIKGKENKYRISIVLSSQY